MTARTLQPIVCGTDFSMGAQHAGDVAGVIRLGSHGDGGNLSSVMGSVARAVITRSSRPVLIVHPLFT